jgi:hypothetical protein
MKKFKFEGYKIDSMVLVKSNGLVRLKLRKPNSPIIGKTFTRNNLIPRKKLDRDIPIGESLEVRSFTKQPVINCFIYYTSRGFYVNYHILRKYYVEV